VGLQQGSCLSPGLYALFINDLASRVNLGVWEGGERYSIFLYADDIVLLAGSAANLQELINTVESYAKQWQFRFNARKCKVMAVGEPDAWKKERSGTDWHWRVGDVELEEVRSFRYLGVDIAADLRWTTQANRAFALARGQTALIRHSHLLKHGLSFQSGLRLWSSLVLPSLLYGAEVWSPSAATLARFESLQHQFACSVLGVSHRTPNVVVRGDLGLLPVSAHFDMRKLNFIGRLRSMPEERAVKQFFLANLGSNVGWFRETSALLSRYRLTSLCDLSQPTPTYDAWKRTVRKAVWVYHEAQWWGRCAVSSKAHDYALLNPSLSFKSYLLQPACSRRRQASRVVFNLRAGGQGLAVDDLRRSGCAREDRMCPLCNSEAETATHFLLVCPALLQIRTAFFREIERAAPLQDFLSFPVPQQAAWLMCFFPRWFPPLLQCLFMSKAFPFVLDMFKTRHSLLNILPPHSG
jgi:hypothetical protein